MTEALLTEKELAQKSGFSTSYIRKLRMKEGAGPPFLKINTRVRYHWTDYVQWLEKHRSTGGPQVKLQPDQPLDDNWVQLGTVANKVVADLAVRREK